MKFVLLFFLYTLWVMASAATTTTTDMGTSPENITSTTESTTESTTVSPSTASSSATTASTSPSPTPGSGGSSSTNASSSGSTVASTTTPNTATPNTAASSIATSVANTDATTPAANTTAPAPITTTTTTTTTTAPPWDKTKFVTSSCNEHYLFCTELNVTTKTPDEYCPIFLTSKDCINSSSCNETDYNILNTLTCGPYNALNNTAASNCLGPITNCLPDSVKRADVINAKFQFNTLFCGVVNTIKTCITGNKLNCTETDFKAVRKMAGCSTASRVLALLPLNLPVIFLVLRMTARG